MFYLSTPALVKKYCRSDIRCWQVKMKRRKQKNNNFFYDTGIKENFRKIVYWKNWILCFFTDICYYYIFCVVLMNEGLTLGFVSLCFSISFWERTCSFDTLILNVQCIRCTLLKITLYLDFTCYGRNWEVQNWRKILRGARKNFKNHWFCLKFWFELISSS